MKTVLVLVMLCCSAFLSAQTLDFPGKSGNDFMRLCAAIDKDQATTTEYVNAIRCQEYLTGFLAGMSLGTTFKREKGTGSQPYCIPDTTEVNQLIRVCSEVHS
jgi:hypothetical protein